MIFSQNGLTFKKVIARLETTQKKSDFSVVADAHAHPRDTRVSLPNPHGERNLVPMFNKNEEKGYFSQSCVVRFHRLG